MDIETQQGALTIRLHGADNVITAKETIAAGTRLAGEDVETRGEIPVGHKVATAAIAVATPSPVFTPRPRRRFCNSHP